MIAALAFDTGLPEPQWGRRRTLAASAVLMAHLLLLWAIWQLKLQALPQRQAGESIPIRFMPDRPRAVGGKAVLPSERQRAMPISAPSALRPIEAGAQDSVLPGGEAPAAAGEARPGSLAAPPGVSASASGPLALKPSREVLLGSLSNPAVNDPRSSTPKPTFEERIAMGLDPELCVKMERLPDGEVRRRMGKMVRAQSAIQNAHGVGPHGIMVCQ